jgi:hypothetical protein
MPHDQAYLLAEKKIEETLRSGATKLDLSGMKLTELPESLKELTQLRVLDLSGNQLKNLPDWLGQLKQLRELIIGFPANRDDIPLIDSSWGTWSDAEDHTYSNNPLATSRKGLGDTPLREGMDDYWVEYGSTLPDPYTANDQPFHAWGDNIGDFMRTSQLSKGNSDGDTKFYLYGSPLETSSNNEEVKDSPASPPEPDTSSDSETNDLQNSVHPKNIWELGISATSAGIISAGLDRGGFYPVNFQTAPNEIKDLPISLLQLECLEKLVLGGNPLNPELAKAHEKGLDAIKTYLRNKSR